MIQTTRAFGGMVVAPHHLAAEAGARVLKDGGNAIEAMIAAASTIAVVYPHMNSIGGDNFWLIHKPGEAPVGIDACGAAAGMADIDFYKSQGHDTIPERGPLAALTAAGDLSGWSAAARISTERWGGKMPWPRLLEDAVHHAKEGVAVTANLNAALTEKLGELNNQPGFAETFLENGRPLPVGARLKLSRLAATLEHLARAGADDFYRGDLARAVAADLDAVGSPVRLEDLERHRALEPAPLELSVAGHRVYNMPPPTQGLASLIILGLYERLRIDAPDSFDYVHGLVEATKQAFRVRDNHVSDPAYMTKDPVAFLAPDALDGMAADIDRARAAPWPNASSAGDTVWLGAIDAEGGAVSFIQSLYWEFGSGVVLPETGITWQNRGTSFSLDADHHNCLKPLRRPLHTIQPPLALLSDGRVMSYGAMGGEGQPQTQAMVFSRHVLHGQDLQAAVTAPRWLLGRTWGSAATSLRMENRFPPELTDALRAAGHPVEVLGPFEEIMGHAGALVHHPNGLIEAAWDPRSDGAANGV